MLNFGRAPSPEDFGRSANHDPNQSWTYVRRRLTPEGGRALEILGHAIEYLADEYANDLADKGPLGSADPRVAAIQILKGLNRSLYYSGTQVQPALTRVKRWLLGPRSMVR
jgi:hypothetical protein